MIPNPWALLGFALVALALFAVPIMAQEAGPGRVPIPMDCGEHFCVVQKTVIEAVIKGHNATVEERNQLRTELAGKGRKCPGDRGA